jgi:hypothetical protein
MVVYTFSVITFLVLWRVATVLSFNCVKSRVNLFVGGAGAQKNMGVKINF